VGVGVVEAGDDEGAVEVDLLGGGTAWERMAAFVPVSRTRPQATESAWTCCGCAAVVSSGWRPTPVRMAAL